VESEPLAVSFADCVEQGNSVEINTGAACTYQNGQTVMRRPGAIVFKNPPKTITAGETMMLSGSVRPLMQDSTFEYVVTGANPGEQAEGKLNSGSNMNRRDFTLEVPLDFQPQFANFRLGEVLPDGRLIEQEKFQFEIIDPNPESDNQPDSATDSAESNQPGVNEDAFDPLQEQLDTMPPSVVLEVPFTPQAPNGNWNPPFDEACEESSVLMVEHYLNDKQFNGDAAQKIRQATDWVESQGYAVDITTNETALLARQFYNLSAKVYDGEEVSIENIKKLIALGHPVIIPAAGRVLANPYYSGEGPPYHMLVITGYNEQEFYTNDPGTRRGEDFPYAYETVIDAIHDWTGDKATIESGAKKMLVVGG
jgi:uncharacterized protein YvpB